MPRFEETELILTPDNRTYHLNLKNEEIADHVILVGDPGRVQKISSRFSDISYKSAHREFIAHTGTANSKRITVLSTGIGPDNIDIVMNELDAAVNIDPVSRELNKNPRVLNVIRLGTSGSIQPDIEVNELVTSSHGIGLDGLLHFYEGLQQVNEPAITDAFIRQTGWNSLLPAPYCVRADEGWLEKMKQGTVTGITATAPGFYAPQGRQLRLTPSMARLEEKLAAFRYGDLRITNFEMETSAIYGLGKLLGHRCITVCVIIANRARRRFTTDYEKSIDLLIEDALNKITS
jgi:uridine phosphorylase